MLCSFFQRPDGLGLDGLDHAGASPLHVSPLAAAHIHSSPQMAQISPPQPIYISTEVSILDSNNPGDSDVSYYFPNIDRVEYSPGSHQSIRAAAQNGSTRNNRTPA